MRLLSASIVGREFAITRRLWPAIRPHRLAFAVVAAAGFAAPLAETAAFALFVPLFDILVGPGLPHAGSGPAQMLGQVFAAVPADWRLAAICGCILVLTAAKSALVLLQLAGQQRVVARIGHDLRMRLVRRLVLGDATVLAGGRVGALLSTLTDDIGRSGHAVSQVLNLVVLRCTGTVYLVALLVISWRLTLVVAATAALIGLVLRFPLRRIRVLSRRQRMANGTLGERMVHMLTGGRVIRDYGQEERELARFGAQSRQAADATFRAGLTGQAIVPLFDALVMALIVGIVFVGARDPAALPTTVVFLLILYRFQPTSRSFTRAQIELIGCTASVERVMGLMARPAHAPVPTGMGSVPPPQTAIVFEDVGFAYGDEGRPALSHASFTIPAGRTTALVGRSGAGKSTVADLLLRGCEPTSGRILVDGTPLSTLDPAQWRRAIGMVRQEVFLVAGTVAENIAYGRDGATAAEIAEAARRAHAHDFIAALPRGYDTRIGAGGAQLSGGERQRITLARAILRDPAILILDEATNALDAISERIVQDAIDAMGRTRTVIVVAHRPAAIEQADHVVVLEDGIVIEEGSPDELRRRQGLFARLHEAPREANGP